MGPAALRQNWNRHPRDPIPVGHSGLAGSTALVQDFFDNVLASVENGAVTWTLARLSSYGPVRGHPTPALSLDSSLEQSLGWRGKRVDETGLICLGARYYDPVAGRFASADPLGHGASMDLYSFCGGDPVNSFDPDGRGGARNTDAGTVNAPPPLQLGIGPYMTTQIGTSTVQPGGTMGPITTGATIGDPNTAVYYYAVTQPTGQSFSYALDRSSYAGPLLDPNYGTATYTPIPSGDVENQQRLWFLLQAASVVPIFLTDGAATGLLGVTARVGEAGDLLVAADRGAAAAAAEASVWDLGWGARGMAIEQQLGANLPAGFPVIDRFEDGIATSIKSIDLNAVSYQDAQTLGSQLNGYVDKLAGWQGQPTPYGRVAIQPDQITERTLQIAFPSGGMSTMQQGVFNAAAARARSLGVKLLTTPIP